MDEGQEEFFQKSTGSVNVKIPRKAFWILGIIILLGIVVGLIWHFRWYEPSLNWYNRASVTIKVREGETYTIEGATVMARGISQTTDINGKVSISNLVAGNQEFVVSKEGYQEKKQILTLKRGDNDLQYISLEKMPEKAYAVKGFVQDYVSGEALVDVQVTLGTKSVKTDPSGAYLFDKVAPGDIKLILSKAGYHDKEMPIKVIDSEVVTAQLPLVPLGQVIFVSNRAGHRNLYTADLKGENQALFVEPKNEGEDLAPSLSPNGSSVAFSSTRDKIKSSYGDELTKLYLTGEDGKDIKKVSDDVSPTFTVVWAPDTKNLYFSGYTSTKLEEATYKIYNLAKATTTNIGEPAYNVTFSPDGNTVVYYVNTSEERVVEGNTTQTYINAIKTLNLISGERKTLAKKEQVLSDIHFSADSKAVSYEMVLDGARRRFEVVISSLKESEIPADSVSKRLFVPSPDTTKLAFIEERDGKRDLFLVDKDGKNEKRLSSLGTLVDQSAVWDKSGRYITFAIKRDGENALYIVSTNGGEPKKITDIYLVSQAP